MKNLILILIAIFFCPLLASADALNSVGVQYNILSLDYPAVKNFSLLASFKGGSLENENFTQIQMTISKKGEADKLLGPSVVYKKQASTVITGNDIFSFSIKGKPAVFILSQLDELIFDFKTDLDETVFSIDLGELCSTQPGLFKRLVGEGCPTVEEKKQLAQELSELDGPQMKCSETGRFKDFNDLINLGFKVCEEDDILKRYLDRAEALNCTFDLCEAN